MGKNYKLFSVGEQVEITHVNPKDLEQVKTLGKIGTIEEVRCSFCKINVDGKVWNRTYGQFKKI